MPYRSAVVVVVVVALTGLVVALTGLTDHLVA
jgi:hypothetical protein